MTVDRWYSQLYNERLSFVYEYGRELVALLDPRPGERILDLGCGTGHLASQIAESGANVVGMDKSSSMVEAARRAYPQLQLVTGDAADFAFDEPFDAVFSNAALHWVLRAEDAARCIARALRPGGRFVAELGGRGNVAGIVDAMQQAARDLRLEPLDIPWYYPTLGEYASLLERHGLAVSVAWLFDRPTPLEGEDGMLHWLRMFGSAALPHLDAELAERLFALAVEHARPTLYVDGRWLADYRRLRVVARRE